MWDSQKERIKKKQSGLMKHTSIMETAISLNTATLRHHTKVSIYLSSLWSSAQDQHWDNSPSAVGTKELSQAARGKPHMGTP